MRRSAENTARSSACLAFFYEHDEGLPGLRLEICGAKQNYATCAQAEKLHMLSDFLVKREIAVRKRTTDGKSSASMVRCDEHDEGLPGLRLPSVSHRALHCAVPLTWDNRAAVLGIALRA